MVRGVGGKQFDESLFEIPQYWGKVFMYNSPSWNVLFPIVDKNHSTSWHVAVGRCPVVSDKILD